MCPPSFRFARNFGFILYLLIGKWGEGGHMARPYEVAREN